jgi:hypothetical protein
MPSILGDRGRGRLGVTRPFHETLSRSTGMMQVRTARTA